MCACSVMGKLNVALHDYTRSWCEGRGQSYRLVRCLFPLPKHAIRELNLNKRPITVKIFVLYEHVSEDC